MWGVLPNSYLLRRARLINYLRISSCHQQLLWFWAKPLKRTQATLLPPRVPHPPWEALPPTVTCYPRMDPLQNGTLFWSNNSPSCRRFHSDFISPRSIGIIFSRFAQQNKHLNESTNIRQAAMISHLPTFSPISSGSGSSVQFLIANLSPQETTCRKSIKHPNELTELSSLKDRWYQVNIRFFSFPIPSSYPIFFPTFFQHFPRACTCVREAATTGAQWRAGCASAAAARHRPTLNLARKRLPTLQ